MKWTKRLKLAFSDRARRQHEEKIRIKTEAEVLNRYEAGQRWSPRRSSLIGFVRDARFDADSATRLEIVRKARYFERNSAILNRLADLFEEYTVGSGGLRIVPASSDEEWNAKAAKWWNTWQRFPDVTSLQSWPTIQSLISRSWCIDGEIFILKTAGKERGDGRSFPRIQLCETHRIATPPQSFGDTSIVDGIQIIADGPNRGRPAIYWMRDGVGIAEEYKGVPASEIIHVFEPSRVAMYRGLPFCYPIMNDLHDLDDLQMLEMDAAKEHAKNTAIIKTKSGEASWDDLRRARFGIGGSQGTSGGSGHERSQYYDEIFEGRVRVLRTGDEYEQHGSQRPSVATKEYWDYLTSKICAGFGISKLLVFPWSIQGTVVRADLDVASAFFRSRSMVLASKFIEVYEYVMGWAVMNERDLSDPPADWKNVSIRPPRSVNVDIGRNAQALIAEYQAGWRTLESICGELGEDWVEVLRQRAIERRKARTLEQEYGLKEGELIEAALEAIKTSSPGQMPAAPSPSQNELREPEEEPA